MIKVTLRFGARKLDTEVEVPISIRQLIGDASRRAVLGYPENVTALVDGRATALDTYVNDGDDILLEKQAAAKA